MHRIVPRSIERAAQLAGEAYKRALRGPGYLNRYDAAKARALAAALRAAADDLERAADDAMRPIGEREPGAAKLRLRDRPRLLPTLQGESAR